MPIFYRGAGINTYWYLNNPAERGFTARTPELTLTVTRMMHHISRGTANTPFISMTRSYAVARDYAVLNSTVIPTLINPAYIYEIEIPDPLPAEVKILDPVKEVAEILLPPAMRPSYQHDGSQEFLLGVVDPRNMGHFLMQQVVQPPSNGGTPRPPNLTLELETLVRALRDAELLVYGNIPENWIQNRFDVY